MRTVLCFVLAFQLLNNAGWSQDCELEGMVGFTDYSVLEPRATTLIPGDLDLDGDDDLIVLHHELYGIHVMTNDGTGTFETTFEQLGIAEDGLLTDLNGDNYPDLILIHIGGDLSVYLNTTYGTLLPEDDYSLGSISFTDIAVGDIDSDGDSDIATVTGGEYIRVLLNNGNGTFSASVLSLYMGGQLVTLEVNDFDNDGDDDILLNGNGINFSVAVAVNDGNGNFNVLESEPVPDCPSDLALGYFNDDPFIDIAVASNQGESISVLVGNGVGTFTFSNTHQIHQPPGDILAIDMNDDGLSDVVFDSKRIHIMSCRGDGLLSLPRPYGVGLPLRSIIPANLNGDTLLDIAGLYSSYSQDLLLTSDNLGQHRYEIPMQFDSGPYSDGPMIVVDLDSDGLSDVISIHERLEIRYGNEDGHFGPIHDFTYYEYGVYATSFTTADVNLDGKPDVLLPVEQDSQAGTVLVLMNMGNREFSVVDSLPAGVYPRAIERADFNADNIADFAVLNIVSEDVTIYLGDGTGSFMMANPIALDASFARLHAADLNDDGYSDLIVFDDENIARLMNKQNQEFEYVPFDDIDGEIICIATFDIDEDRDTDIVVSSDSFQGLQPFMNTGNGSFVSGRNIATVDNVTSVLFETFDDDGFRDLIVSGRHQSLLRGAGNGTFGPVVDLGNTGSPKIWVGQLDDNNSPDIITGSGNAIFVSLNPCPYDTYCPADFDASGAVDVADLQQLIVSWGTPDGDIDGNGLTNAADLLLLISAWGTCE